MRSLILVFVVFGLVVGLPLGSAMANPEGRGAGEAVLTLHVLDCGTLHGMDAEPFLPDVAARPDTLDLVDRCYLVVHPKGTLLWDAGLPTGFYYKMVGWVLWLFGAGDVEAGPALTTQLAELGMEPADVDWIALSHSHFDHVGQAEDFASSTWLVQRTERDFVFDPELDNESVFPELVEPLSESEKLILDGDHDVFGDGRVQILSAPGHTPGHQCLFIDLPETGPIVLSGDLYHSKFNREYREPPAFNTDREQTRASMERIEKVLSERGARLWIQHDPESGPLAPATLH